MLIIDMKTLERIDQPDREHVVANIADPSRNRDAELVDACCEVWKRRAETLESASRVLSENLLAVQADRDALQTRVRELEHEAIERSASAECHAVDHSPECAESWCETVAALQREITVSQTCAVCGARHHDLRDCRVVHVRPTCTGCRP